MSDISIDDVVKALGNLSVVEMIKMTKELEEKWGVKAEPPKVQVQVQDTKPQVVQTEFTLVLTSFPADKKMSVLKAIREVLGLGLKEAKDFVESTPKTVKEELSKEDAEALRTKLVEAGGTVEVK